MITETNHTLQPITFFMLLSSERQQKSCQRSFKSLAFYCYHYPYCFYFSSGSLVINTPPNHGLALPCSICTVVLPEPVSNEYICFPVFFAVQLSFRFKFTNLSLFIILKGTYAQNNGTSASKLAACEQLFNHINFPKDISTFSPSFDILSLPSPIAHSFFALLSSLLLHA